MPGKLNRICEKCGEDYWSSVDNPTEYVETCHKCLNLVVYNKQELINKTICPKCNGTNITKEETDNELIGCCSNCGNKTIILYKKYVAINNRNMKQPTKEEKEKFHKFLEDFNAIKCPKCGSKNITTSKRGFSIITGFIGANKTVNRCAKCGHHWTPKL